MKKYSSPTDWESLCKRPTLELEFLDSAVKNIITRVKLSGDDALKELTLQFDGIKLDKITVPESEIDSAQQMVSEELKKAIRIACKTITAFHTAQKRQVEYIETIPGVICWRKALPIEQVGIYVPGGSAPLFSTLLMLGIPATLAGCKEIILCSPPGKDGKLDPSILFAAKEIGITKIFKVGGAQAIAAMAYGTQTIPRVSKIFGPGNQYVTKAKQMVSMDGIAIDMPAGPSEVLVIADDNSNPAFVAADLLSQAEHGADSQVVLVTTSSTLQKEVEQELDSQLDKLPRKEIAKLALQNSLSIQFTNDNDLVDFVNAYAPEHLIINTQNCEELANRIINAGSVFLGPYSPESVGDYASGTNHTLPTNGYAKAYSGVSLESFLKYITFQQLTPKGLQNIGPVVETMAAAEDLMGHKNAVSIRLTELKNEI